MSNAEIKQYLHRKIDTIDDEATLLQIEEIVNVITDDSKTKYDSLSKELKSSIYKGIKELDEGKTITYEEIRKNILNVLDNK